MHQKTQNHFLRFSTHLSVRKSRGNYRQIYGKSKESLWRNLSTGTPPKFFQDNPLLCSFSLQVIFCSEQPFYGNYSTLDSHTNTVISHAFCLLVKMASKTATRSSITSRLAFAQLFAVKSLLILMNDIRKFMFACL